MNDVPDQFGNSLSIQVYNKETKQATYLANLKLSDYQDSGSAPAKSNEPDLPFYDEEFAIHGRATPSWSGTWPE